MATLDFEREIAELENKLAELRKFSEEHDVDIGEAANILEERIEAAKKRIFADLTPWQRIQLARHPDRPYPMDYVNEICRDFVELHGDRRYGDDHALFGGFARLGDRPVMLIGTRKGRDLKQNVQCNFGSAHPEGYRKALRCMQLANKAKVPVVTLIDTAGAYPGVGAEKRHIGEAIAVNLREMFALDVPVVVVVVGEGGSGGALGIGVGNRVLILEYAYYSVISPEGCAAILWRDGKQAPEAAAALKLTATDLLELGIVDQIVPEPLGAAHRNRAEAARLVGQCVEASLAELSELSPEKLRCQRYDKFRAMGVFTEG